MVIGRSLFSPISVFSTKMVGFVKTRSYCSFWQWGQIFTFLAFSIISSLIFSRVITAYAAFVSLRSLYFARSSAESFILLHDLQDTSNNLWISSTKAICKTASANSMCPKCPGQFADVFPQVPHFWPGSNVPSLLSMRPPCTAIPSSS